MGSSSERILLIGPHPDDVFLSCAGFIIKNAKSYGFDILCATSKGISKTSEIRIREEINAWTEIGNATGADISLSFFDDGVDTQLFKTEDKLISHIEHMLQKQKAPYRYVFTPFPEDTHQDHKTVSNATLSATRYHKNIIFYETPSTINFYPNMYVEIEPPSSDLKVLVSKEYESVQIFGNKNHYQSSLSDYIVAKLLSNGAKSRVCKMAEGYRVQKIVI